MSTPPRRRWYQFSLATLLALMTLSAFLARPAWRQWQRYRPQWADVRYWWLGGEAGSDEPQRAAVQRGLEWLRTHQGEHDSWQTPGPAGQTQESDL